MPTTQTPTAAKPTAHDLLGPPTWFEGRTGFPPGGWGDDLTGRPDPESIVVATPAGDFTGRHAGDVVAFTEFLAGAAFDRRRREWLIDAMAAEFSNDPGLALAELEAIGFAVHTVPVLEPLERANNRHRALTSTYLLDAKRERAGLPDNPILVMVRAHNPAVLVDDRGVVVTADAVEARRRINRLILALAGRDGDDQPLLRHGLIDHHAEASLPLRAELAGSWIRLVALRAWLARLDIAELARLRARLAEVVDTATDLDLVGLQLSFRSMVEAIADGDSDGDPGR